MKPDGASVEVVARLLNLTPRRIQQLVKDGVLPQLARGRYDPVACVHAYIEFWQSKAEHRSAGLESERQRKVRGEADRIELELAKEREQLIHMDDVADLVKAPLVAVAGVVRNIPQRFASVLVPTKCPHCKKALRGTPREVIKLLKPAAAEAIAAMRDAYQFEVDDGEAGDD